MRIADHTVRIKKLRHTKPVTDRTGTIGVIEGEHAGLQFLEGQDAESLELSGKETFAIKGQTDPDAKTVSVTATAPGGHTTTFEAQVRIDTPKERDYYENGGILHYALRHLAA